MKRVATQVQLVISADKTAASDNLFSLGFSLALPYRKVEWMRPGRHISTHL
jgi:hypothetical protein